MDTKTKILTPPQALHLPSTFLIVTGYYDPLLAPQAARLANYASQSPVLVLLTDPPNPLLPLDARAQLVAALSAVTYVLPLAALKPAQALPSSIGMIHEEALHLQERDALLAHIQSRHASVITT